MWRQQCNPAELENNPSEVRIFSRQHSSRRDCEISFAGRAVGRLCQTLAEWAASENRPVAFRRNFFHVGRIWQLQSPHENCYTTAPCASHSLASWFSISDSIWLLVAPTAS